MLANRNTAMWRERLIIIFLKGMWQHTWRNWGKQNPVYTRNFQQDSLKPPKEIHPCRIIVSLISYLGNPKFEVNIREQVQNQGPLFLPLIPQQHFKLRTSSYCQFLKSTHNHYNRLDSIDITTSFSWKAVTTNRLWSWFPQKIRNILTKFKTQKNYICHFVIFY